MTVINSADDLRSGNPKDGCSNCGKDLRYPYVEWDTYPRDLYDPDLVDSRTLLFCTYCCEELRRGLGADFDRAVAIRNRRVFLCTRTTQTV